ncbi:TPA: hypothetical protein DCZ39_01785 [Patescibacteria group bacterium]|nr:hypothetical protein [Candidatus Gracilibacteria bacterium]
MTFDACTLDLSNTFTGGQAYTALSRSKTLSGITLLNKIEKKHLFFSPSIKIFIKEFLTTKPIPAKNISEYIKHFD